jgi:multicomponent Na+:H+ antiporter subunit A
MDIALILCALAPFVAAALMPMIHRAFPEAAGWIAALVPAAAFISLWQFLPAIAAGEQLFGGLGWGGLHGLALGFRLDGLSLTFSLAIAGIGAFILVYSGIYLHGHEHRGRFLSFMLMFMGAMQGLVLSDNMVALYVFWELTSVTSFLLIGFEGKRHAARRAATQALVVTGMGGLALLAGAILMERIGGSWQMSELGNLATHVAYPVVLVLVLLAAFTKSAQFPFQFWLPNAMEAPTPVSAYLHSATMVQAGVYLLARLSPTLGDSALWTGLLMSFGAVTLLWGAFSALRQTDLKQMLAQSTVASLGLLVLLIGVGTKLALLAVLLYFLTHALYKAALFLIAGAIDHETGSRDITVLGGLRSKMPLTFIATGLAALSMIGLPPVLGYIAKEEMYLAMVGGDALSLLTLAIMVVGNALLAGLALAVLIKPFFGPLGDTPQKPHEAPIGLLAGPLLFGVIAVVAGLLPGLSGDYFVVPGASAIAGEVIDTSLHLVVDPTSVLFWLSVATWALGLLVYLGLARLRRLLTGLNAFSFDAAFDAMIFGLIRFSAMVSRLIQNGRLEVYLFVVFVMFVFASLVPLVALGGLPQWPALPDLTFYEWGVVGLALLGLAVLLLAQNRLFAILALGIQGMAVALLFMLFGAPDLSFTQFMVEILSVVILALVMTRLNLDERDARPPRYALQHAAVAGLAGLGVMLLLFVVLQGTLDPTLSDFFNTNSKPAAHGSNVVNVILVDFRGLDTLGEISVVMAAGIAVLALIRGGKRRERP